MDPRELRVRHRRRRTPPPVAYVDPETLRERRSGTARLRAQVKFYRDEPKAPAESWPARETAAPVAAD